MSTNETNTKSATLEPKGFRRLVSIDKESIYQYDEATMMRDSELDSKSAEQPAPGKGMRAGSKDTKKTSRSDGQIVIEPKLGNSTSERKAKSDSTKKKVDVT